MRNIFAAAAAVSLLGCSMSQSFLPENTVAEYGCNSTAGAYSLPKTIVSVRIGERDKVNYLEKVELLHRADPTKTYCLDYLGSRTAEEGFAVQKNDHGLLQKIVANSHDQSATIAKQVAKTVFTVISQNPDFDPSLQTLRSGEFEDFKSTLSSAYHAEFDPFNKAQSAVVNAGLGKFGFCIIVESQGISQSFRDIDGYCDAPLQGAPVEQALQQAFVAERQATPIRDVEGILYRPRLPYTMYLFVKRDLKKRGGWRLKASEAIHIENQSPILGIGIERAVFANRKTTLTFDDGVLNDVEIDKTSELQGFVQVPLYIAQGIAALPANIIQVKINQTNNNIALINAQDALLSTQKQYNLKLKELAGIPPTRAGAIETQGGEPVQRPGSQIADAGNGAAANPPAARDITACVNPNSPEQDTTAYCQCMRACVASRNNDASVCEKEYCNSTRRN